MSIDFDLEAMEMVSNLGKVEGYLDYEIIIIYNIKKQLDNGFDGENVIVYLNKLSSCLYKKIETSQDRANCTNYRYTAGFVDTLLKMPYRRSWMMTINMCLLRPVITRLTNTGKPFFSTWKWQTALKRQSKSSIGLYKMSDRHWHPCLINKHLQ